jgi:hypothetical protein
MFLSSKKSRQKNRIANTKTAEQLRKLKSMYPPGNYRINPLGPSNKIRINYARKTLAAKIIQKYVRNKIRIDRARKTLAAKRIQKYVRLLKNIEKAKQTIPHTRTINNPLWKKFYNYQMKRANEQFRRM